MKIKQYEAVKAYRSISELNKQKLSSGRIAKQIYDLTSKLQPAFDFQVQEERKIYGEHPEFDFALNGIKLEGKTEEEKKASINEIKQIEKELKDLSELDFDIESDIFDINLDENRIEISGEDIGNLEKFINFI